MTPDERLEAYREHINGLDIGAQQKFLLLVEAARYIQAEKECIWWDKWGWCYMGSFLVIVGILIWVSFFVR